MNTDRHFGNFGLLVDSRTNEIIAPAPLFHHGNSLLDFAGQENWDNEKLLMEYADTLMPCTYDSFLGEAKECLDDRLREKLRKMLDYDIKKAGKYNYPAKQLKLLSKVIQKRIMEILK